MESKITFGALDSGVFGRTLYHCEIWQYLRFWVFVHANQIKFRSGYPSLSSETVKQFMHVAMVETGSVRMFFLIMLSSFIKINGITHPLFSSICRVRVRNTMAKD